MVPWWSNIQSFPHLVTDQSRQWGESCLKCPNNFCSGHYVTDLDSLIEMWKARRITPSRPPNEIIQTFYNSNGDSEISEAEIENAI